MTMHTDSATIDDTGNDLKGAIGTREVPPEETVVVTVGKLAAGTLSPLACRNTAEGRPEGRPYVFLLR